MLTDVVACWPPGIVAWTLTWYVRAIIQRWLVIMPVDVAPSPKLQFALVGAGPVVLLTWRVTSSPTCGLILDRVICRVGWAGDVVGGGVVSDGNGADVNGAVVSGVDVRCVVVNGADVGGAIVGGAIVGGAIVGGVDVVGAAPGGCAWLVGCRGSGGTAVGGGGWARVVAAGLVVGGGGVVVSGVVDGGVYVGGVVLVGVVCPCRPLSGSLGSYLAVAATVPLTRMTPARSLPGSL